MIWALSDPHLSFSCNKSMTVFGEAWENYTERIADACRRLVAPNDILLMPGDISWAMNLQQAKEDLAFLHTLPGLKVISRGNHDYWWASLKKMREFSMEHGFNSLLFMRNQAFRFSLDENASLYNFYKPYGKEAAIYEQNYSLDIISGLSLPSKNRYLQSSQEALSLVYAGTRSWLNPSDLQFKEQTDRAIYEREIIRLNIALSSAKELYRKGDIFIVGLHYPPITKRIQENAFLQAVIASEADICIYGHLHAHSSKLAFEGLYRNCNFYNVACDNLDMTPLLLDVLSIKNTKSYFAD